MSFKAYTKIKTAMVSSLLWLSLCVSALVVSANYEKSFEAKLSMLDEELDFLQHHNAQLELAFQVNTSALNIINSASGKLSMHLPTTEDVVSYSSLQPSTEDVVSYSSLQLPKQSDSAAP